MSDITTKSDAFSKHNEHVVVSTLEAVSENLWIIGVSKTHPGLKYYFNTVTGVSLWNISREDMERAKQTMNANGNQPQYINCPEPKDPPPSKRTSTNLPAQICCDHISQQSKSYNKQVVNSGFTREMAGIACDICYASVNSSPNIITVNFRSCPHGTCISPLDNACSTVTQSEIQSSTALLDSSILENNHYNKSLNNLLGSKRALNRNVAEVMVQDPNSEHVHNQYNTDNEFFNYNTSHLETLDLTSLKMFAKNGVIQDKWYIIADTDVYLHHITFLKSIVNSDNQCCLMVPQNVKIELEHATKTELRTKAHCASYYIYNMFDYGFAHIDEDSLKHIQHKSNEEHILDCYMTLKEQNFYVVVISNDLELQKYSNKICMPIFTVTELKEYLYKSNHSVTTKSSKPTFNVSPSRNYLKVSAQNNSNILSSKLSDFHKSIITNTDITVKRNQNIQTSLGFVNGKQVQEYYDVFKITADAEVQTNFQPTQLGDIENVNKKIRITKKNDDNNKRQEIHISNSQSCAPSPDIVIDRPSKRIKLKRRRICDEIGPILSIKLINPNESHTDITNTPSVTSSNDNLLLNKKSQEQNKKILNSNENLKSSGTTAAKQRLEENYIIQNQTFKPDRGSILQFKKHNENIQYKNVMFEVTTELMDQTLRRKCDEWVSRFVQIMEEALTQVLRKKSSLYIPPPWNMYGATICIEKTFNNDEDVADASKKFLNVLNKICDEKGNVNANISPMQYMEMYSLGVYMIDSLQGIFSTCEDLQAAAESLSKLLNDIHDPESDLRNIEPFHCISQEVHLTNDTESANDNVEVIKIIETESLSNERSTENTENVPNLIKTVTNENDVLNNNTTERCKNGNNFSVPFTNTEFSNNPIGLINNKDDYTTSNVDHTTVNMKCNDKSQEDNNVICNKTTTACNTVPTTSPSKYNLRSKRTTMSSEKQDELSLKKVNNVKNDFVKNTFLSNFFLEKNLVENKTHNFVENFGKNITIKDISDNIQLPRTVKSNEGCSNQFNSRSTDLSSKTNTISHEPKIIRNFVICSEFEDRLNLNPRHDYDETEEIDFEDALMATDYMEKEEPSGETGRLHIDEFTEYHDNIDIDRITEQEKSTNIEYIDFKYFIKRIAEEIKELTSEVYTFSQTSCEALNSLCTPDEKITIRGRAEQVHLCINKLSTALTNILNRDENGCYNLKELIKHTEFDDISVDEHQMDGYGAFIARCLEQACDLKNTIKDVLSAVCEI